MPEIGVVGWHNEAYRGVDADHTVENQPEPS